MSGFIVADPNRLVLALIRYSGCYWFWFRGKWGLRFHRSYCDVSGGEGSVPFRPFISGEHIMGLEQNRLFLLRCWKKVRVMKAETIMDNISESIGIMQREENRCAQLLYFLNRLEGLYKISTGKSFRTLRPRCRAVDSGIIHEAIREIKEAGVISYDPHDIDPNRTWRQMTLADMEVIDSVLKYSALDEFLLILCDEAFLWSCKVFFGNTEYLDFSCPGG